MWILVHGRIFCNINNRHPESSPSVIQSGICTKIDVIPYMFRGVYTDCYILYRARRYLIAFLGIFIFVGCVVIGTVFADLRIKKETARKNLTVARWIYSTGDIIRIIPYGAWSARSIQMVARSNHIWSAFLLKCDFFALKQKWQFFLESNARPKTRITPMFFAIFQKKCFVLWGLL